MNPEKKVYFILAMHNHQPVGNLDEVLSHSFAHTYEPFISALEKHPEIKVSLHYSGSLLDWIVAHQPDFIKRIRGLIEKNQVEIMGGAYYEPILPVIPDEDKVGQIRLMSERLEELFGTRPTGMWLAERVWEPHLPRPVHEAGIEYIAVDDTHFFNAGFKELFHYYRTEEDGCPLDIYPINEELRYLVPFKPAHETIDYLQSRRDESHQRLFVLADDGEKFGGWPGTYNVVYEEGWLEQFFNLLKEHSEWLNLVTFSEYRRLFPPEGPVYLPGGSYREMNEWSRGFWRNFFYRYPESNRMHKKMLAVRRRLNELPPGSAAFKKARLLLWAGQCNCAYWHGIFGGLYLNFLRAAIWEKLLKSEQIIEETLQHKPFIRVITEDRFYAGEEVIVVISDRFSLLFSPRQGGSLWELSWRIAAVNLLDTLTRRPEAYHQQYLQQASTSSAPDSGADSIHHHKLVKEEGLMEHLHYDPYPRGALMEHFLEKTVTPEQFIKGEYRDPGSFLLQPADVRQERLPARGGGSGDGVRLHFHRSGQAAPDLVVDLEKTVTIYAGEDQINVDYRLTHTGHQEEEICFAVEFNFACLGGYDEERGYYIPGRDLDEKNLAATASDRAVKEVQILDQRRDLKLALTFSEPALLWRMPVETVSLSEGGLERTYQQSLLLPRWDFILKPQQHKEISLVLALSPARSEQREEALSGSAARN
jgi:alpha-amylase